MPHAPLHIFDTTAELKRLSEMIFVEGGTFLMGEGKDSHCVKLDSFYIGKYPVTQALWKAVMNGENPSHFKGDDLPIEEVSWDDTQAFIVKLNKQTGKTFRLPTEAEWEYAAKGGTYFKDFPFIYSGSNKLNEVGWYYENSHDETKPVGLKTPNFLGIHDMSGNVREWCNDWYGSYEDVIKQSVKDLETDVIINPVGVDKGQYRVYRGGSWRNYAQNCRPTSRNGGTPTDRDYYIGFRLVLFSLSV